LAKEDASMLIAELARRTDYRVHSSPHLIVHNGQTTVIGATRRRNYVRGLLPPVPGQRVLRPDLAPLDEGFSIELSPLLSLDRMTIDAVIKCNIDQVEKTIPVKLELPGARQWFNTEVPQIVSCRLHERFRWPTDKVLLISLGVVPTPAPQAPRPLALPISTGATRADMLVLIENKGPTTGPVTAAGRPAARHFHGRY